jgi:2-phospho-L-lactate/phosphoenolpyruvate guanylyltransferase
MPGVGGSSADAPWLAVMPVKRLAAAKSRLRGALAGVPHEDLALALVLDTAVAALGCPVVGEVAVVTDDPAVRGPALALGARVVPDEPGAGLNPAFRHGARLAAGRPVAALAGDLPALRAEELAAALAAAAGAARGFVADAEGTGTTLLTARGVPLDPRFGPGSAAAHAASGAAPLTGAWPTLRQDVDTPEGLRAAARLGLGVHTAALLKLA